MEKQFYKCILLVLASDNNPLYVYFKKAYESYVYNNPDVKIFFVYGNGIKFEPREYDLVYDVLESYTAPCMARKTVLAMEYIDQHFTYEYLVRTNLSTFWVLDNLVSSLSLLPKTKCLAGKISYFEPHYITGIAMYISFDLVPAIVRDQKTALYFSPKYIPEDQMISQYFMNVCGVIPIEFKIFSLIENLKEATAPKFDQILDLGVTQKKAAYRVKNLANRYAIDTVIIQKLCQKFYNVDIGKYDGNVQ